MRVKCTWGGEKKGLAQFQVHLKECNNSLFRTYSAMPKDFENFYSLALVFLQMLGNNLEKSGEFLSSQKKSFTLLVSTCLEFT